MRIVPIVNSLLVVIFLAVLSSVAIMALKTGYNDAVSHACFKLLFTGGLLMMAQKVFNAEVDEENEELQ